MTVRGKSIPIVVGVLVSAASMLVFGFWALLSPSSFIDYVNYHPLNEHLVHDAGAFQIGIGAALLFALVWSDALVVAMAGFAVASAIHTMTHYVDRHMGGHDTDVPILSTITLIAVTTISLRLRKKATP
jgi:hypothetical protein